MDKIYAQAFREKRLGGEDKKARRLGGAGSSGTKKKRGPNLREFPEPLFRLARHQGVRGRHPYENRQKLDVMGCVVVCFVVIFSTI